MRCVFTVHKLSDFGSIDSFHQLRSIRFPLEYNDKYKDFYYQLADEYNKKIIEINNNVLRIETITMRHRECIEILNEKKIQITELFMVEKCALLYRLLLWLEFDHQLALMRYSCWMERKRVDEFSQRIRNLHYRERQQQLIYFRNELAKNGEYNLEFIMGSEGFRKYCYYYHDINNQFRQHSPHLSNQTSGSTTPLNYKKPKLSDMLPKITGEIPELRQYDDFIQNAYHYCSLKDVKNSCFKYKEEEVSQELSLKLHFLYIYFQPSKIREDDLNTSITAANLADYMDVIYRGINYEAYKEKYSKVVKDQAKQMENLQNQVCDFLKNNLTKAIEKTKIVWRETKQKNDTFMYQQALKEQQEQQKQQEEAKKYHEQ